MIQNGELFYDYFGKMAADAEMESDNDDNDDDSAITEWFDYAQKIHDLLDKYLYLERAYHEDCVKRKKNSVPNHITLDTDPLTADSYKSKGNSNNNTRPPPELIIPSQCLMTETQTNNFPYTRID